LERISTQPNNKIYKTQDEKLRLLELCTKEGIIVFKPFNLIITQLEEIYDARVWFYVTIIQAIVFNANNFVIDFPANSPDQSKAFQSDERY
jgi:hypothetical protein